MKKNYYYKDRLIRTSEHDYRYAVIIEAPTKFEVCLCTKELGYAYRKLRETRAYWQNAKDKLPQFEKTLTLRKYQEIMSNYDSYIENVKIVRLEVR